MENTGTSKSLEVRNFNLGQQCLSFLKMASLNLSISKSGGAGGGVVAPSPSGAAGNRNRVAIGHGGADFE